MIPAAPRQVLLLLSAVALAGALSACGHRGSGVSTTEQRELAAFDRVQTSGSVGLVLHVSPDAKATAVAVTGDHDLVPTLLTEVKEGVLHVRFDSDKDANLPLEVSATTSSLRGVHISGAAHARIDGLRGGRFELEVSGAGHVTLAGAVDELRLELSGAADVEAKDLRAERATLRLSGAGKVRVYATRELDARVSGAAQVTFLGKPATVRRDIHGLGSINPG